MNKYISNALSEIDKVNISRLEHPGEGALDTASCRFLAALMRSCLSKRVLEFGSGFSSFIIAREIASRENNFLLSLYNSSDSMAIARDAIDNSDFHANVKFYYAPQKLSFYGGRLLMSYSLPDNLSPAHEPFDLVLISPSKCNSSICEASFRDSFPSLCEGGFIVISGANSIGFDWQKAYKDIAVFRLLEGIGKGVMVVEKIKNGKPAKLSLFSAIKAASSTIYSLFY